MIWLIAAACWLCGAVLGVRPMLRRTMLKKVCNRCDGGAGCDCRSARVVVRGAQFDRSGHHVFMALWNAAWWPVWLPAWLAGKAFALLGRQLARTVIGATPLTEPEMERKIAQQATEIERLTAEIAATPP